MMRRVAAVAVVAAAFCAAALAQSPFLVADINRAPRSGSYPTGYHVVGNVAFFYATTPRHGFELWRTDGTIGGTTMVKELNPGPGNGYGQIGGPQIADLNGAAYFVPNDGNLWKSDGTAAGTTRVATLPFGAASLTGDGQHLFFTVGNNALWVSDGTAAGTHPLTSTVSGALRASTIMPGNGITYFVGRALTSADDAIWRTDGTAAGTTPIASDPFVTNTHADFAWSGTTIYIAIGTEVLKIVAGSSSAKTVFRLAPSADEDPQQVVAAGSGVYFEASAMDGTRLAVQRIDVATDNVTVILPVSYPVGTMAALGDKLLIVADLPWITDGTAAGTQRLAEDIGGVAGEEAVAIGNAVYFTGTSNATLGSNGRGIFRTDGTRNGTTPLRLGLNPTDLTRLGNLLLFSDAEPWRSDGTTAGTSMIRRLAPITAASSPRELTATPSAVYFAAVTADFGATQVWRTDGYNTVPLTDGDSLADVRTPCNGGVLFTGCVNGQCGLFADANGRTTSVSRGSTSYDIGCAGKSAVVSEAADVLLVNLDTGIADLLPFAGTRGYVSVGGRVFFEVSDATGNALMQTDGTKSGTSLLVQADASSDFLPIDVVNGKLLYEMNGINAVPVAGGSPMSITTRVIDGAHFNTGSQLLFSVNVDGQDELWATDGTPNGTTVVGKLGGPASSFATSAGRIYVFDANGTIWMTNGSSGNLLHVADSPYALGLGSANGLVYFGKFSDSAGVELWVADGTAGTHLAADINVGPASSSPGPFAATDRLLFFPATDDFDGEELWALPIAGQGQPHRHAVR